MGVERGLRKVKDSDYGAVKVDRGWVGCMHM